MIDPQKPADQPGATVDKVVRIRNPHARSYVLRDALLKEGVDPDLARKLARAFDLLEDHREFEFARFLDETEQWMNLHRHLGSIGSDGVYYDPAFGTGEPGVRPTYPFLAAYGEAGLLGSPNGVDWFDQGTVMPWEAGVTTRDIRWIPEHALWLASSSSNRVATSPDGLLWTAIVTPYVITGTRRMGRIGWDGSVCIIGCDSTASTTAPFVLRSTDLDSWTIIEDATNLDRTDTPLKIGTRWVVKNGGGAAYSDNGGLTWVNSSLSTGQNGFLSQDGNGNLYRHASNNSAHWSSDGAVWSTATSPENNSSAWVGHYSSRLDLVLLPNQLGRVYTTINFPPSWTLRETGSAATVNVIKETANGIFVAGMSDGTVWTSPDSIEWTNRTTTPGGASVTAVGGDGSV